MNNTMTDICVSAFYKFTPMDALADLQSALFAFLNPLGIKGTVLLADEGINGTIAGTSQAIDQALAFLRTLPGCADLEDKNSRAPSMPFVRLKIRIKAEIIKMGVPEIDPARMAGNYVKPQDWNALITDPDTITIDTRNDYEVALGTFKGAINPRMTTFGAFPEWFARFQRQFEAKRRTVKIAMFCTGGIRCEKSTAYAKSLGGENIFHLQGGILKYLETVPEKDSLWDGECFVFDNRVSVGHGLKTGTYQLCHACRLPIKSANRTHPDFEQGVSCPHCHGTFTPEKLARLREREKQVRLAQIRGEQHIGDDVVMRPRQPANASTQCSHTCPRTKPENAT